MLHLSRTRRLAALLSTAVAGALAAALLTAAAGTATPAAVNPLDSSKWAHYSAPSEGAYAAWRDASGEQKTQLAKIAMQPRVIWFTDGSQVAGVEELIRKRVEWFQRGDRSVYAQLAVFGLYPDGEWNRDKPFTTAMQNRYKAWVNAVARGIGSSRVVMILEPDLAVAWGGWRPGVRFALAAYASRVFAKLPNVTIYLDGSDADWLAPDKAVRMLIRSGVANVDGIALGSTHYSSAASNILYGADLVRRLAARGYKGKRFVIDTADNGRPFTPRQFYARFPNGQFDNANLCRTRSETRCLTLGIPPTTDTASARWRMSAAVRSAAARYCDAFLWFGRPWLYKQASPFQLNRALAVARTTPWQ